MSSPPLDFIIAAILTLKSGWQLTGSLDSNTIKFTTGYYNEQLNLPQVSVTPLVEPYRLMNIGPVPTYFINHIAQVHVWVRPPTNDGASLGQAKNARYRISQEVERIIRSGSTIIPGITFAKIDEVFDHDDLKLMPPLIWREYRVKLLDFRFNYKDIFIFKSGDFKDGDFNTSAVKEQI